MIEVELPDGSVAEFPDGTSQDVMKSALQKRFSAPRPAPEDAAALQQMSQMTQGTGEQNQRSALGSIANSVDSAVRGAADTATFGFADELAALGQAATGLGGDFGDYGRNLSRERITQEVRDNYNPYSSNTGRVAGALGTGVGLAKSGATLAGRAINSGSGLGKVAAASGIDGAVLGALQGFGSGEGVEDRLQQAKSGGIWGLGIGAAVPVAVSGVSAGIRKAITPFTSSPERQAAVGVLNREGIPLTAGQKTGSDWLRYQESVLGGKRAANVIERQGEAFTDAAMRRAGGSGRATSDNMAAMADRLGKGFEDISARNAVRLDRQIVTDFNKATNEYARVLPSEQKTIFHSLKSDIADKFRSGNGSMSGSDYQTIRSRLTRMAKSYRNNDTEFSSAIRGLRDALDEGMERSIIPQDAGQWAQLRRQYGNMKVLERAATGGGEGAAMGIISPARLRMAASQGNRGAYARGQGDFAELAKAGQAAMTPLPNSGTAQRLVPTVLGAAGYSAAGPIGVLGALAAPTAAGRGLMSAPMQKYLANQALTGPASSETRGLLNMILNMGANTVQRRIEPGR